MKIQIVEIKTGSIGLKKKISVIQEDTARKLKCILSDFEIPDDSAARIYAVKPSGNKIYNDGVIEGNTVLFDITTQLIAEIGEVACQVEITESNGNVLTSFEFVVEVKKRLKDASAIESTNEFTALEAALGKVQNIDTKVSKNTNDISELKKTDNVLSSRIDMLSSLKEGSTTADAELLDIRVKADGSLATSAGNAVREQFDELKGDLDEQIGVKKSYRNEFIKGAYINGTEFVDNGEYRCLLLDVKEGQKYRYWGAIKLNICVVINFTDDNGVNKGFYDRGTDEVTIINDKEVIVPQEATKMYVTFIVNDPQDYQFDLYRYEYGVRSKWYGKKVMCIGDSITQGVYWNGTEQVDSDYPYTFYLKEILEFSEVKNLGASGMTIANNSNQVQWLWLNDRLAYDTYKEDNDLVIIFAGTNDFGYSTPLGDFTSVDNTTFYGALNNALFTLLNRFPNKYKKHKLVLCTPIHRTEDTTPNNVNLTLKDYRDAIIKVAERFSVDCIDLYSVSGFNAIGGIGDTEALLSDGLHPTKIIGYQRLGEVIADKLNNI